MFTQIKILLGEDAKLAEVEDMLKNMNIETQINLLKDHLRDLDDERFAKILRIYLDNLQDDELIEIINAEMPERIDNPNDKIFIFESKDHINRIWPHTLEKTWYEIYQEKIELINETIDNLKDNIANNIPSTLSCVVLTSAITAAHWILLEVHTFKNRQPQLIITDSLQNERVFNDEITGMFVDLIMPGTNIYYEFIRNDNFTKDKLEWAIDYNLDQYEKSDNKKEQKNYGKNCLKLIERYSNMTGQNIPRHLLRQFYETLHPDLLD